MNEKKETQSIAAGRRNSRCVIDRNGIIGVRFLRRQQCRTPIAQKGSESAGNARRCFLFVFPSSEVIDEHLGPMSVKAYHVCLALNFFRNVL